jgi:glutamyl-tRNA reductase
MRILCVGMNHQTAPLELREKLAFGPEQAARALRELHDRWADAEFLLLSTCNRTELYVARPLHSHPREEELTAWLGEFHTLPAKTYRDALYVNVDGEAIRHMFTVAAGLDSMVPGEGQIVSQVKAALSAAEKAHAAGPQLQSIVTEALHVSKHVRSETGIAAGKVSVASVAVDCIKRVFETLAGKCVLSIGAGKMNEILLRQIRDLQPERIIVTNRSADRAESLAAASGATAALWEQLPQLLEQADVVVTSTASASPVLTAEMVRAARQGRQDPLLLVDLAVPRDIAAAAAEIENVSLYNVDDLEEIAASALETRRQHLDDARAIVEEHYQRFIDDLNVRAVTPTIEALYRRVDAIIEDELAEATNKLSSHDDMQQDMEILQRSLRRAMRRLCHPAADALRGEAADGTGSAHAEIIRKLFNLKDE